MFYLNFQSGFFERQRTVKYALHCKVHDNNAKFEILGARMIKLLQPVYAVYIILQVLNMI